jgi:hypothetical protein
MISDQLHIDVSKLRLSMELGSPPLGDTEVLGQLPFREAPVLFLAIIGEVPATPIARAATESSANIPPEVAAPLELRHFQSEFGPRAVSMAHFEFRNAQKPNVDDQPESSCYAIRTSGRIFRTFTALAIQGHFAGQRLALLFGRPKIVTGKVTVHCVLEPEQVNGPDRVDLAPTFDMNVPRTIADLFDMQCVGMAVSRSYDDKIPVPPYLIERAAHFQLLFGEHFTTLIVMPDRNTPGHVTVEAFQVKDCAVKMAKDGYFAKTDDPKIIRFKEPLSVYGAQKTELRGDEVNLLLCAVRIRTKQSKIPLHEFPSPASQPTPFDLGKFLADHEFCPTWYKLFDFNLLVYLATKCGIRSEQMATIVQSIRSKTEVPGHIMAAILRAAQTRRKT